MSPGALTQEPIRTPSPCQALFPPRARCRPEQQQSRFEMKLCVFFPEDLVFLRLGD